MHIQWPGFDTSVLIFINRSFSSDVFTWLMRTITDKNNWFPFLFLLCFVLMWWGRKNYSFKPLNYLFRWQKNKNGRFVMLALLLAVSLSDFSSNQIKHAVGRQRPNKDPETSMMVIERWEVAGNRSFPSSHSANSAAIASVIVLSYSGQVGLTAILFAFLVGFSRIYLGVHYPIDVLVGWMIGSVHGLMFWLILRRKINTPGMLDFTAPFRHRTELAEVEPDNRWILFPFKSHGGTYRRGFMQGESSKLAVLVHGLNSSCFQLESLAGFFRKSGYTVLLIPMRGHESSCSFRCTGGVEEAYDLVWALNEVECKGWKPSETVLYGNSMGAAAVIKTAALLSCRPYRGIISHASFASFFDAVELKLGKWKTGLFRNMIPARISFSLQCFNTLNYLKLLSKQTRAVFIHGLLDRVCPPQIGRIFHDTFPESLLIFEEKSGHPAWVRNPELSVQQECVFLCSLNFIEGNSKPGIIVVDETGTPGDDTGSFSNRMEE